MESQRVGHDWATFTFTSSYYSDILFWKTAAIMDYTVHGMHQTRILEWIAFPFSRGSSQPRDWIQVSCIAGGFFTSWATREAQEYWSRQPIPSPGDLPTPGIKPGSPALQADSLPTELSGKPKVGRGEEAEEGNVVSVFSFQGLWVSLPS